MSYTAPDYVDTKSQAILALASVIADEDKTALGDGSVNKALDVLADVLAESDVQVPQTNAGAILALAQYVNSGGGGGGSETRTIQLLCIEVAQDGTIIGPTSASITAPTVSLIDVETQQGTQVDIGEKSTVTVDEITGVWKYEFDVTAGEIYSIGGETTWTIGEFASYLNSDAQDPTVYNDVFVALSGLFTPTNYSTTVIVSTENII